MKGAILCVCILIGTINAVRADSRPDPFEDQDQYELFYEFTYQANVVESLLLECTGDRRVSYKFAFATAPISNSYKKEILGLDEFLPDPFTNKPLATRLWDEITLMFSRDYASPEYDRDSAAEPVLMAQKDVLRIVSEFPEEKESLCDFVFWEEVLEFDGLTHRLFQDAKMRRRTPEQHERFAESSRNGLAVLQRLFDSNPLKLPNVKNGQ